MSWREYTRLPSPISSIRNVGMSMPYITQLSISVNKYTVCCLLMKSACILSRMGLLPFVMAKFLYFLHVMYRSYQNISNSASQ